MNPEIDYEALFAVTPSPYLVLAPDLVIADVNQAYLRATGRTRDDLVGRHLFDAFPDNPDDPDADGVSNLGASLGRVLATAEPDIMAMQRYDISPVERPGVFEERWWSPVNTPLLGHDGRVAWIIHRVEDVTAFVRSRRSRHGSADGRLSEREEGMEAELYARARELQRLNEELRAAHAREREVAVTLQEAMLHSPDLERHTDVAVRYLPAIGSLNVCGDWYDTVDLPDGRFTVAVGDVVGHGLEAATVMGMLRSALSAASRAVAGPAQALEVLGMYARSVDGALVATAVSVLVDTRSKLLVYSSAGHPPPVLVHTDGTVDLLERATDPPLGARPEHVPRPQAGTSYRHGDTLILYTDGLIERRDEDIDTGLNRLTSALGGLTALHPERLADALLTELGVSGGARDDIALVAVRL
ncbi:magnesium or manganese-dependent protein phosphatase [Streptomyces zinciresistens K42]|uniref:Magnesium or manganese-dependent protein phosphatase n=1 Tax=Streptomyces zinciresistens K42 TaxID=700597 RepID=G2GEB2_9ACTN|nr:SpoIIE family protein phosphatase [Streptomyces zinciresistens]EGX58137.1 magnesium or manganese-dependent protein phosphatase [Streptomyces zinciresistens K42]